VARGDRGGVVARGGIHHDHDVGRERQRGQQRRERRRLVTRQQQDRNRQNRSPWRSKCS